MHEIDWSGCPYNYKAHIEELKKLKNNGITDYNRNNYHYHESRVNRCLKWYFSNKKHVLLKHNPQNKIKPYHIETYEKYITRLILNKKYELIGIYFSEKAAFKAMIKDAKKYKGIPVREILDNAKVNDQEPKYSLRQLRGAWGAGRNSR